MTIIEKAKATVPALTQSARTKAAGIRFSKVMIAAAITYWIDNAGDLSNRYSPFIIAGLLALEKALKFQTTTK